MVYITALTLAVTGYRFGKEHRWGNTWQYRHLKTVRANQLAERIVSWFT